MEATLNFSPQLFGKRPEKIRDKNPQCNIQLCNSLWGKNRAFIKMNNSVSPGRRPFLLPIRSFPQRSNKKFCVYSSDQLQSDYVNAEANPADEAMPSRPVDGASQHQSLDVHKTNSLQQQPKMFRNRFRNFTHLRSVLSKAGDSFFKSEVKRRVFVTAALIIISRVGYYIPLPGFDRRLIPKDYLSFISGSVDELGDFSAELKMSFFQLGISPQIFGSIVMQVLCLFVPSLIQLRKEGLDGQQKIKGYIRLISLAFAIVEAMIVACYSLPYSIYAASYRVRHVMVTSVLLVCGATIMAWICETISESGIGQGTSLIVCVGILMGYVDTLNKLFSQLSGSFRSWGPNLLALLGVFTIVTMLAAVLTKGYRKLKMQFYGFRLASALRENSPITEVEPYIPFNINPAGMQPVLTTAYFLAIPSILASIFGSPFWVTFKEILNPETSLGAEPWVYYSIYAFCVFVFNILDIANMPKEITDYMNKIRARIPNVKPGKATIDYLTKVQASTRFWGGLLLSIVATASSIIDHRLRHINEGYSIGFTSVLIIVGSIIELRRSYQAYNVMPSLSKALSRYGV